MKLRLALVAAALMTVGASAYGQSATPAKPAAQAQPAAPAGKVENGGVLYKKVGCYQCHANEAQGGLSGPRIGPNLIPYPRFLAVHPASHRRYAAVHDEGALGPGHCRHLRVGERAAQAAGR